MSRDLAWSPEGSPKEVNTRRFVKLSEQGDSCFSSAIFTPSPVKSPLKSPMKFNNSISPVKNFNVKGVQRRQSEYDSLGSKSISPEKNGILDAQGKRIPLQKSNTLMSLKTFNNGLSAALKQPMKKTTSMLNN